MDVLHQPLRLAPVPTLSETLCLSSRILALDLRDMLAGNVGKMLVPDREFVEVRARGVDMIHLVAKTLAVGFDAAEVVIGYALVSQHDEMFWLLH